MISEAGRNIKAFRAHNGISQMDFAAATGIAQTTISSWECGITSPRRNAIEKVLDAYPSLTWDLIMSDERGYQKSLFKYQDAVPPVVDGSLLEICRIWQDLSQADKNTLLRVAQSLGKTAQ